MLPLQGILNVADSKRKVWLTRTCSTRRPRGIPKRLAKIARCLALTAFLTQRRLRLRLPSGRCRRLRLRLRLGRRVGDVDKNPRHVVVVLRATWAKCAQKLHKNSPETSNFNSVLSVRLPVRRSVCLLVCLSVPLSFSLSLPGGIQFWSYCGWQLKCPTRYVYHSSRRVADKLRPASATAYPLCDCLCLCLCTLHAGLPLPEHFSSAASCFGSLLMRGCLWQAAGRERERGSWLHLFNNIVYVTFDLLWTFPFDRLCGGATARQRLLFCLATRTTACRTLEPPACCLLSCTLSSRRLRFLLLFFLHAHLLIPSFSFSVSLVSHADTAKSIRPTNKREEAQQLFAICRLTGSRGEIWPNWEIYLSFSANYIESSIDN